MNNGGKSYPTMEQGGQQMYQASDGRWYPVSAMPQQQQPYGQPQMGYSPQNQQTYYVQGRPAGAGYGAAAGAGTGLAAGLCAGLLCCDIGLCLF